MAILAPSTIALKDRRTIILRSLSVLDAETFLNFRRQIPQESNHTKQYVGMDYPSLEKMAQILEFQEADSAILNIGAFDCDRLVGFLNFRALNPQHPWIKHVAQFGMMVLKEYWGQGLGRELLKAQDVFAHAHGVNRIEAHVRVANERAVQLYLRSGFQIEGTRQQAAIIDNQICDEYYIAKILKSEPPKWLPPTLKTDRLILRPINIGDAQSIFDYSKNPNVSRYTLWEPHRSLEDSKEFIQNYVFKYYQQAVPEPLGVALKEDVNKIIGTVGCFWTSKQAKAMELAYAFGEDYWGKGFAAEASQAMIDYCFKEFSLKRIQARCKIENKASSRVMEKIGMTYEGTLRSAVFHRGKYWDMSYYAKVKEL
ncbi:MAG: GNAT family N-acetyltransferase [Bdellovibrionia bacterium]